jgi:hypothetical protein
MRLANTVLAAVQAAPINPVGYKAAPINRQGNPRALDLVFAVGCVGSCVVTPSAVHAIMPSAVHAIMPSAVHAIMPSAVHAIMPSAVHAIMPSAVNAITPADVLEITDDRCTRAVIPRR